MQPRHAIQNTDHTHVLAEISDEPLKTPITLDSIHKSLHEPKVDAKVEQSIIKQICQMYEKATKPIVLVDACAIRYGVQDYTRDLIERTGMVCSLFRLSGRLTAD